MFSSITYPDGTPFECDTRHLLKEAVKDATDAGLRFTFGAEMEFYLFLLDEFGKKTLIPSDEAGYMDIAPDDHGENVRREICLTLEKMSIHPESSHHEEGPGQSEIDFRYSDPLMAADNAQTFQRVVKTVADRNGLCADFSPKPLKDMPGNGFHINMSVYPFDENNNFQYMIAGIMKHIKAMTLFLNPTEQSYTRLGNNKAPGYITQSAENRSQLIRIPAAVGEYRRAELRSPDPCANPYLAFALLIWAGLDGIRSKQLPPEPANVNLYTAPEEVLGKYEKLPGCYQEACKTALQAEFIRSHIPSAILDIYSKLKD
jgi:glutamine synthetase